MPNGRNKSNFEMGAHQFKHEYCPLGACCSNHYAKGTFSRRLREIGGLDEQACWGDTVLFTTVSRGDVIVRNAGQILTSGHYI